MVESVVNIKHSDDANTTMLKYKEKKYVRQIPIHMCVNPKQRGQYLYCGGAILIVEEQY